MEEGMAIFDPINVLSLSTFVNSIMQSRLMRHH